MNATAEREFSEAAGRITNQPTNDATYCIFSLHLYQGKRFHQSSITGRLSPRHQVLHHGQRRKKATETNEHHPATKEMVTTQWRKGFTGQ